MTLSYFESLCRAMEMLAEHPKTVFMGQAVACPGTAMSRTFARVPREQLLELPVIEDAQLGMATGMSLAGYLPVCCYPRSGFLLFAMSQLVLHLDKLPLYSSYRPKVIVRTAVATDKPLHPGPQHLGDHTAAFRALLETVVVERLDDAERIVPAYREAVEREGSTLLIEQMGLYDA